MKEIFALLTVLIGFLVWLAQRRLEMKIEIFNDAVKALSLFEVDVGNQKNLKDDSYMMGNNRKFYPFLRDETLALIGQCSGLINAFFSNEVSSAFDRAIYSVSLDSKDDYLRVIDMYDLAERKKLIIDLSKELSISFILME